MVEQLGPLLDYLEIALNLVVMVLLILLFFRRSHQREEIKSLVRSLEDIAKEHEAIAKQFEVNVEEKRRIVEGLRQLLDQRIEKAEALAKSLGALLEEVKTLEGSLTPTSVRPDHEQILRLARKGFSPQTIAHQLHKSVTEVELVIKLYHTPAKVS